MLDKKVLLVCNDEENDNLFDEIELSLHGSKYQITKTTNENRAIEILNNSQRGEYGLIITDVYPLEDRKFTLLSAIKENKSTNYHDLPIIGIAKDQDNYFKDLWYHVGGLDFLIMNNLSNGNSKKIINDIELFYYQKTPNKYFN